MLAMTAVQAVSQIGQGNYQKAEADYNATLLEGKAGQIDIAKGIANAQDMRAAGLANATSFANMAGMGVMPKGSPMAVINDMNRQMAIDRTITQYNLEQEKTYTMNEAESVKRQGKYARQAGYTNAFSTLLSGASTYAMYKYKTTFDLDAGAKKGAIR